MAGEIAPPMPAVPEIAELLGLDIRRLSVKLSECLNHAADLQRHALGADGRVRNARLVLAASDHQRRVVETFVRAGTALVDFSDMDRLLSEMIVILRQETPKLLCG